MQKWTWSREIHETNAIFAQLMISDYQTSPKYKVRKACRNCRRAHSRCSETRPCRACVNSGKAHTCDDGESSSKEANPRNTARFHPWTQTPKDSTKNPSPDPLQLSFSNIKNPNLSLESGTGTSASPPPEPLTDPVELGSSILESQHSSFSSSCSPAGTPLSTVSTPTTPHGTPQHTLLSNPLPFGGSPYPAYNRGYHPHDLGLYSSTDPRSRSKSEDISSHEKSSSRETHSTFSPQFSPSQYSPSQYSPSPFSPSQFSPSQFSSSVFASPDVVPLRPTCSDPLSSLSFTPIERISHRRMPIQTQTSIPKWELPSQTVVPIRSSHSDGGRLSYLSEPQPQILGLRQTHSETSEEEETKAETKAESKRRPTSISFLLN